LRESPSRILRRPLFELIDHNSVIAHYFVNRTQATQARQVIRGRIDVLIVERAIAAKTAQRGVPIPVIAMITCQYWISDDKYLAMRRAEHEELCVSNQRYYGVSGDPGLPRPASSGSIRAKLGNGRK
jgi:hypothetical protein